MKLFKRSIFLYLFIVPSIILGQQVSRISGRVLGNNGLPMILAHVSLCGGLGHFVVYPGIQDTDFIRTRISPDGSFSLTIDSIGPFYLVITGVGHYMMQLPLILDKPVNLNVEVHLKNNNLNENLSDAEVRYDFDEVQRGKIVRMKHISSHLYESLIPYSRKEFKYQFFNIDGSPNGTSVPYATADSFEYGGEFTTPGDYTSIINNLNDTVKVYLHIPFSSKTSFPAVCSFSDSQCTAARFIAIHQRFDNFKRLHDQSLKRHLLKGHSYSSFSYDWVKIANMIKDDYLNENVPILKQEIFAQYLELGRQGYKKIDTSFIRVYLKDIPTTSYVWIYHGSTVLDLSTYCGQGNSYVNRLLAEYPSRSFQALLLMNLCSNAKLEKRRKDYIRYYHRLTTDYLDTDAGQLASQTLRWTNKLEIGKNLPEFKFPSVDDEKIIFTNSTFSGKYLLIDFWATWCGPCVGELKYLQKAYEKYHTKNLEILSVSFDVSTKIVKYFQLSRFNIPWFNSHVDPKDQPNVDFTFEVTMPKLILVGPNNQILEIDKNIRGLQLEPTLAKYLARNR